MNDWIPRIEFIPTLIDLKLEQFSTRNSEFAEDPTTLPSPITSLSNPSIPLTTNSFILGKLLLNTSSVATFGRTEAFFNENTVSEDDDVNPKEVSTPTFIVPNRIVVTAIRLFDPMLRVSRLIRFANSNTPTDWKEDEPRVID